MDQDNEWGDAIKQAQSAGGQFAGPERPIAGTKEEPSGQMGKLRNIGYTIVKIIKIFTITSLILAVIGIILYLFKDTIKSKLAFDSRSKGFESTVSDNKVENRINSEKSTIEPNTVQKQRTLTNEEKKVEVKSGIRIRGVSIFDKANSIVEEFKKRDFVETGRYENKLHEAIPQLFYTPSNDEDGKEIFFAEVKGLALYNKNYSSFLSEIQGKYSDDRYKERVKPYLIDDRIEHISLHSNTDGLFRGIIINSHKQTGEVFWIEYDSTDTAEFIKALNGYKLNFSSIPNMGKWIGIGEAFYYYPSVQAVNQYNTKSIQDFIDKTKKMSEKFQANRNNIMQLNLD